MLEILLEFMLKTLKSVIVENYLYNLCGKLVIELVLYMLHRFIAGGGGNPNRFIVDKSEYTQ